MSVPSQSWHDPKAPLCKECGHIIDGHEPALFAYGDCKMMICDCRGTAYNLGRYV